MLIFFFNDTATTEIYTLSLHDALPISRGEYTDAKSNVRVFDNDRWIAGGYLTDLGPHTVNGGQWPCRDRKSTRLNSSHGYISYAVFCLKKKNHPVELDNGGTSPADTTF